MSEWQDIASAPKDGSLVLLRLPPLLGDEVAVTGWRENGAFDQGWYDTYGEELRPTHWMPLPPPPSKDPRHDR